jgi:hypothetical protein
MTTTSWVLAGMFAAGGVALLDDGSTGRAESVGDVLQLLLPASAYAMTWIGRDGQGARQYTRQLGVGILVTYGFKEFVTKRTPSADDHNSFPSAHSQAAFSGASFIHRRYGARWGVPAYVLATYTGLSRVKAERHYLDDVIAGMSIALINGWIFVDPVEGGVTVNPMVVDGGFGLSVSASSGGEAPERTTSAPVAAYRWRYTWEMGRAEVIENLIQAPSGAGDVVDFRFRERNNPSATSTLQIDRSLGRRHQLSTRLAPFEVTQEEHYGDPVTFGGATFDHRSVIDTRYLGYDWRARWRYELLPDSIVRIRPGAGLELLVTRAEIQARQAPPGEAVPSGGGRDFYLLPVLHLHLGLVPYHRLLLYAEADGGELGGDRYLDWTPGVSWSFRRNWELGLSYRRTEWELDSSRMSSRFSIELMSLVIGYRW